MAQDKQTAARSRKATAFAALSKALASVDAEATPSAGGGTDSDAKVLAIKRLGPAILKGLLTVLEVIKGDARATVARVEPVAETFSFVGAHIGRFQSILLVRAVSSSSQA